MVIDEEELKDIFLNSKKEVKELFYIGKIELKKIDFEEIFDIVKNEIEKSLNKVADIGESIYENILKETIIKKRNWLYYEMNTDESIHKKTIKSAEVMFARGAKINDCETFEEYMTTLTRKLKEWKENKEQDLSKFEYIESKRITTIKKALVADIQVFMLKKIIQVHKTKTKSKYEVQINSLVSTATDPTNRVTLQNKKDNLYFYENTIGDNYINFELKLDDIKNQSVVEQADKVISQILKVLNDNDITIFQHLIKHRSSTFFNDGIINFYLDDFCKEVFGYSTTPKKNLIIASLTKMSLIRSRGYTENDSSLTTSLISDLSINKSKKKNEKTEVRLVIGLTYREEIINGNITKVHSYLLEAVGKKNSFGRKLLYFLQKERIVIYYSKDKNEIEKYIRKRVPYTYFSNTILFTNKNKTKVLNEIEKNLDIIKNHDVILSDETVRDGEYFNLYYKPISEEEIKDLEKRIENSMDTDKDINQEIIEDNIINVQHEDVKEDATKNTSKETRKKYHKIIK